MISLNETAKLLTPLFKAGIVPYLKGPPGIGKSSVLHTLAQQHSLKIIDLRLSQCDPTELSGFPYFDHQTKTASYYPLDVFPIESTPIPTGFKGWLCLLDEFSSASLATQAAAYKLVLDRMVGQHKLHPNVVICAAGNREEDNAIVNPMSSALVSRFAIFDTELNYSEWMELAIDRGISSTITSYLRFKPESLYTFKPETADKPYACPRTWFAVDRLLKTSKPDSSSSLLFSSLLGTGVGVEFANFIAIQKDLPTIEEILANPEQLPIPDDHSIRWAVIGFLAENITAKTIPALSK